MEYGPELQDRIEELEGSTSFKVQEFHWDEENGERWVLGTNKSVFNFVYAEFQELFTTKLVKFSALPDKCILKYKCAFPKFMSINTELTNSGSHVRIRSSSATSLEIYQLKPRFFESWAIVNTGGGCTAYEKQVGPIKVWVTNMSGESIPSSDELYDFCVYDEHMELLYQEESDI